MSPSFLNAVVRSAVQLVNQLMGCIGPLWSSNQSSLTVLCSQDMGAILFAYTCCSASVLGITWVFGYFYSCWKCFECKICVRHPDVCWGGVLSLSCSCSRVFSRVCPPPSLIQLSVGQRVHCLVCSPSQTEPPWRVRAHFPKDRDPITAHTFNSTVSSYIFVWASY